MDIPIILIVNSINNTVEMETTGIAIIYNKQKYIVTVHQGLSIKTIKISTYEFTDFIVCGWNDLILIPINVTFPNLFVFKHFVKKQINVLTKLNSSIKYIDNEFFPINMIPENPPNLYYKMSTSVEINGGPVYNNKNLVGIISKTEDNILYVIPAIYIIKSCEKIDNTTIYTLNCSPTKINRYKVINKSIYYRKINSLIPVTTYIALEGDKNTFTITINNKTTIESPIPFINTFIKNSMNLEIDECIHINSCFLHLMKIVYNDTDLIKNIFRRTDTIEHKINDITYSLI